MGDVNNFGYMERLVRGKEKTVPEPGSSAVVPGIWSCPHTTCSHFSELSKNFHEITLGIDQKALSPISAGFSWDALVWSELTGMETPSETVNMSIASKGQSRELPLAAFSCRGLNKFPCMSQNMGTSANPLWPRTGHCLACRPKLCKGACKSLCTWTATGQ